MRKIVGWSLIIIGIPFYVLPIPLGIFLITPGLILLFSASPQTRRKFVGLRKHFPRLYCAFKRARHKLKRNTLGNGAPAGRTCNDEA